ncbi:MAG: hypothetical protein NVSMB9_09000 [Isosphaeraceae bacterium]
MVSQDQVDAFGGLALEGTDKVDELMRPVSLIAGIHPRTVDQLLQDEMPSRMPAESGDFEDLTEGGNIAMQVANHHHLARVSRVE